MYCESNALHINKQHAFTLKNMHAEKQAFPWLTCKGSDTVVIMKWVSFYAHLMLLQNCWSASDRQALMWVTQGADKLRFSQGIHQHGIWLERSCVMYLRQAVQGFGDAYGYVPKLHALMHFRTDLGNALAEDRRALNSQSSCFRFFYVRRFHWQSAQIFAENLLQACGEERDRGVADWCQKGT